MIRHIFHIRFTFAAFPLEQLTARGESQWLLEGIARMDWQNYNVLHGDGDWAG
jgi:hypothetical protein